LRDDRASPNSVLRRSERVELAGVLVDRLAYISVLLPGAREQFDGEDMV